MSELINGVPIAELCGYAGVERPELVKEAFDLFGDSFAEFRIVGQTEEKPAQVMLWRFMRKVLSGKDLPNIPQEIGDCVSWGARNVVAHIQALPILNGVRKVFHDVFAPHIYGVSRVQIGGGRIWGDGSVGAWAAAGLQQYGAIAADGSGVPKYSGAIAKAWGKSGPPQKFLEDGKNQLVRAVAQAKGATDAAEAILNGYAVTIASNQGFTMTAGKDGFHKPSGSWAHQMALIGVDMGDGKIKPHFCMDNSWGDVHGVIVDWRTGEEWPRGTLRVEFDAVDRMIRQGDSFVMSSFDGFPAQPIPREMFDLFD